MTYKPFSIPGVPLGGATWVPSTHRLYRKPCGTYFVRALLSQPASTPSPAVRKRHAARISLRTKNSALERRIAAWVNAKLEGCGTMTDRRDILNQIKRWTVNGVTVNGAEDQERFQKFYNENPEFKQAVFGCCARPANQTGPRARTRVAPTSGPWGLGTHESDHAILAARHEVYTQARKRNPARWSRDTRDWTPVGAVTLNPERDSVIAMATHEEEIQPLAA